MGCKAEESRAEDWSTSWVGYERRKARWALWGVEMKTERFAGVIVKETGSRKVVE